MIHIYEKQCILKKLTNLYVLTFTVCSILLPVKRGSFTPIIDPVVWAYLQAP